VNKFIKFISAIKNLSIKVLYAGLKQVSTVFMKTLKSTFSHNEY